MATTRLDPVLILTLRSALALLFAVAALQKLRMPSSFVDAVRDYDILPSWLVTSTAIAVIAVELGIAVGLLFGSDVSVLAAGGMLAAYSAAIGLNIARGRRDINCGCNGPHDARPLSSWMLVRNTLLLLLVFLAHLDPTSRELVAMDFFSIIAALLVMIVLYAAAETLAATVPLMRRLRHD